MTAHNVKHANAIPSTFQTAGSRRHAHAHEQSTAKMGVASQDDAAFEALAQQYEAEEALLAYAFAPFDSDLFLGERM